MAWVNVLIALVYCLMSDCEIPRSKSTVQELRLSLIHIYSVTHRMFQNLTVEEEEHLDYFRTELENLAGDNPRVKTGVNPCLREKGRLN